MAIRWWLFFFANSQLIQHTLSVDAAFQKQVDAVPSCGVGESELFYHISQATLLPFRRNISTCNQNITDFAYPPEAIVDENYATLWQAEGGQDKAVITIDLTGIIQKFYFVKSITISFGDYFRPGQIAFYKKTGNNSFTPWHFLVTEQEQCDEVFGTLYKTIPATNDDVLCTIYQTGAFETNENVTIGLEGGRGTIILNGDDTRLNTVLLDWMNATQVELRFSELRFYPDRLADRWRHYSVREINVEGYCHCNGHADGIHCPYNHVLLDRQCICQEGTCGDQCGFCCPAYNQYPYKTGRLGPFTADKRAACEKCNCYNHSDVCVYNETIAKNICTYEKNATNDECSMNINGLYRGGGVCVGCKDNTEGTNCQRCITKFYRKKGKNHAEKDACRPCNCFVNGTSNSTKNGVEYLDCVRDEEESIDIGNLAPGQCLCKNKTTGLQCDRCIDGYYNLTGDNPQGCLACLCTTDGTVNGSINCNNDGVCTCKPLVLGKKCSLCRNGTFHLASDNQNGCTECMCSNITKNCTSSTMYRIKIKYGLVGWNASSGFDGYVYGNIMNIKDVIDGRTFDMMSVNISGGQSVFWRTQNNYFKGKSLVTSYGGYISFARKVSSRDNSSLSPDIFISIEETRNICIKANLPPVNSSAQSAELVSIKMVESVWRHCSTNNVVDRQTFMLVLSRPGRMWIAGSYFPFGVGVYQTSFGELYISGISNVSDGESIIARDVEKCFCSEAYKGISCERCARGYRRVNVKDHPFFGECIPCTCHGHTLDCDPDTGRCLDCQHNTTGFNCTECRAGFYGNARNGTANDCRKCPCESPKTITDLCVMLPNGSAQCLNCSQGYEKNLECNRCEPGYFGRPFLDGGKCRLCQCNNNSDVCNLETGNCMAYCNNNSTGWHCEYCENGTYGDATKQQCRGCTCDSTGSYNIPCNITTGFCHCKPNVRGFNCSECEDNSYGFNSSGCTQCHCNKFGSKSLQCNDNGVCDCNNHTHGAKCDMCMDYFYGLPNATCQDCACNVTGSNNTICNHESGICLCKSGIEGRQCDRCKKQHKDFSDSGCEPCPACTMKLQGIMDDATTSLMISKHEADQANESIDYFTELENLEGKIPGIHKLQVKHTAMIENLEQYRKTLTNTTLLTTITYLELREKTLKSEVKSLDNHLKSELLRIGNISNQTKESFEFSADVKRRSLSIVDKLYYLTNESNVINESSSNASRYILHSIDDAKQQTLRAKNLTKKVKMISNMTANFGKLLMNQTKAIKETFELFAQLYDELNRTHKELKKNQEQLERTNNDLKSLEILTMKTNATMENIALHISKTTLFIEQSNTSIVEGTQNYLNITDTGLPKLNRDLKTLKMAIEHVNISYWITKGLLYNASLHAENLTALADLLKRNFERAKRHGENALSAINDYEKTTETVNDAIKTSIDASRAVNESIQRIQNLTNTDKSFLVRASECRNASIALLNETKSRNINVSELSDILSKTRHLFSSANHTCYNVAKYTSIFEAKRTMIIYFAASEGPVINNSLQNAILNVDRTRNISDNIELQSVDLKKRLAVANKTLRVIDNYIFNSTRLMNDISLANNQTQLMLANISRSVNLTKNIKRENDLAEIALRNKTAILEEKLKEAKEKVARFRLAMRLRGNTSVKYRPTTRMLTNPLLNIISLDFKTNESSGLLLYMSSNSNNTDQSLSLKLVINRVRFTYNLASTPVVITNWEVPILDDTWFRVYVTRYGEEARLTVTNLHNNFSRTYEGPSKKFLNASLPFDMNSVVLLGGVPPTVEQFNSTKRFFDGDLDNLVLNEDPVSLWKPAAVEGVRRFAPTRVQPVVVGFCGTFHGNGFVKQIAGDFETRVNSSFSFQFRTFFKNALLLYVEGSSNNFIYSLSLNNGAVLFRYNNTVLRSDRSAYDDGKWHNVKVSRTLKNASLLVTSLNNNGISDDYVTHSGVMPTYLPNAHYVYFGGNKESRNHFAGGLKHISLSSYVYNTLKSRNLDDKNLTAESIGVNLNSCLQQVESGLHYFNGYSAVNISTMQSLAIIFKTNQPSGLLAYSYNKNTYLYLALFHGNIFMVTGNASSKFVPLQTSTETLNDGAFHTVSIKVKTSRIELHVDGRNWGSRDVYDIGALVRIYIAGVPSKPSILDKMPILSSFEGDIKRVLINGLEILNGSSSRVFTSAESVGVSAAGVSVATIVVPTDLPTNTPAPPTCGARYPEKVFSEKHNEIHLSGIDSAIALNLNRSLISEMAVSSVISIEFRALAPNGVLFVVADNRTTQFVSLELVDGNLVYQFNTGSGLVRMRTTGTYSFGGIWYKVDLLRIMHFGAMVVRQTKEYHKNATDGPNNEKLTVNHAFIGGVNPHIINTSVLENPDAPSFFGCIRDVEIETKFSSQNFNLSGDIIRSLSRNPGHPGKCYDYVQPQVSFDADGFATLSGKYDLSPGSELSITFRTTKRNGLLFYATNENSTQSLTIKQVNGQMHVLHVDNVVTSIVKWIDPSLKDLSNVNSSYALCNNVYHTVNVRRRNRVLQLRLDRDSVVSTNITENVFIATVHIGGVPDGDVTTQHFAGCIQSIRINTHVVDMKHGVFNSTRMEYGCRAPIKPQETYAGLTLFRVQL